MTCLTFQGPRDMVPGALHTIDLHFYLPARGRKCAFVNTFSTSSNHWRGHNARWATWAQLSSLQVLTHGPVHAANNLHISPSNSSQTVTTHTNPRTRLCSSVFHCSGRLLHPKVGQTCALHATRTANQVIRAWLRQS